MFEVLLARAEPLDFRVGVGPIATYPTNANRATYGLAITDNKLFYTGGSSSSATYLSTGALMNIDGSGVISGQTYPNTGYIGTWSIGKVVNGVPYMYVGHYNAYPKPTFLTYSFASGMTSGNFILNSLVYRSNPAFIPIGGNTVFWGLGAVGGALQRDTYIVDLVAKTSVPSTPYPAEYGRCHSITGGVLGNDGKYYVGLDENGRLVHLDPTTKQWGRSSSASVYFINRQLGSWFGAGMVAYGRYILMFERGQRTTSSDKQACLRYDTLNKRFTMFEFPSMPCRYLATPGLAGNKLYFPSGANDGNPNVDQMVKYNNIAVIDADQFLVE